MVLGTAAEKTRSVHRKSIRNPDFLWKLLAGCDVPRPASGLARQVFPPHHELPRDRRGAASARGEPFHIRIELGMPGEELGVTHEPTLKHEE